jgi:hypothetical protein
LFVSLLAALIALAAVWLTHQARVRDELKSLLERFETGHFHVRMWRMEQLTRGNHEPWEINPRTIQQVMNGMTSTDAGQRKSRFKQALALDWETERFDMQETYFFALQVHAWVTSRPSIVRGRVRKLNAAFGWQLLGTFLDQQITACRLLPNLDSRVPEDAHPSYYATHYGLFDGAYVDLVGWLADETLNDKDGHSRRAQLLLATLLRAYPGRA